MHILRPVIIGIKFDMRGTTLFISLDFLVVVLLSVTLPQGLNFVEPFDTLSMKGVYLNVLNSSSDEEFGYATSFVYSHDRLSEQVAY